MAPGATAGGDVAALTAAIGAIDRAVFAQLDRILHAPAFRRLEAAWRSLHYLVRELPADAALRVRVLAVGRGELRRDFADAVEVESSQLFHLVHDREYGRLGGQPFAALVVDGAFGPDVDDCSLLRGLAAVAAAAHAMVLTAADAELVGLPEWHDMAAHHEVAGAAQRPGLAAWQALRRSPDLRYVVLTAPRILLRPAWDPAPNRRLAYRESRRQPCFGSAAFALAARLADSFHRHRCCTAVRGEDGGGRVAGLPAVGFSTDTPGRVVRPPIELTFTERQERDLVDAGVLPLCRLRATAELAFFATPCLHDPGTDLVPMLGAARFAHYLKCMLRDMVGFHTDPQEIERRVSAWLARYTLEDSHATPERQRRYPLRAAAVRVHPRPDRPGVYALVAHLQPHAGEHHARVVLRVESEFMR